MQSLDLEECRYHAPTWKRNSRGGRKTSDNTAFCLAVQEIWLRGKYWAFLCSSSKMMEQEVTWEVNNVENGADAKARNVHPTILIRAAPPGQPAKTQPPCWKYFPTVENIYIEKFCVVLLDWPYLASRHVALRASSRAASTNPSERRC